MCRLRSQHFRLRRELKVEYGFESLYDSHKNCSVRIAALCDLAKVETAGSSPVYRSLSKDKGSRIMELFFRFIRKEMILLNIAFPVKERLLTMKRRYENATK